MYRLELRIPPVIVLAVAACLNWVAGRLWPGLVYEDGHILIVIATILPAAALLLGSFALYELLRHRTTAHPHRPHTSRVLVQSGVYQLSRNPMYLALLLLLLAWSLYLGHLSAPVWLAAFIWYMTRFQIKPEERELQKLFGERFRSYCNKTRRWI